MLLNSSNTSNAPNAAYLYRRDNSKLIAFGERADGSHQNYGICLSDYGIDATANHIYRLTNRVAADGSNMVYLFVDGLEIGAMNQHFIGGTAQGTTSDWISGKDFTFNHIGTQQFPIGNCSIDYLQIWEDGIDANDYRWETQNDALTNITSGDNAENALTTLSGSITDGVYSDSQYRLEQGIYLRHDLP